MGGAVARWGRRPIRVTGGLSGPTKGRSLERPVRYRTGVVEYRIEQHAANLGESKPVQPRRAISSAG